MSALQPFGCLAGRLLLVLILIGLRFQQDWRIRGHGGLDGEQGHGRCDHSHRFRKLD